MTEIPRPVPEPVPAPMPNPLPDPGPLDDGPDILPEPAVIGFDAIKASLGAGWHDFRRAPLFGLFFSFFYVLGGIVLTFVAQAAGREWWLAPFVVGFPLLAPFAAVGLYEVSRRMERGQPLIWSEVLGVVFAQRGRQVPSMSMVILLLFMFWVFVAHTVFALFVGPSALGNLTNSLFGMNAAQAVPMLLVGTLIGAGFSLALFSFTVVGLPAVLDKEVDFISAIIASMDAVRTNFVVLMAWGLVIVALLMIGIAPFFLGLFLTLPILGHASWHMYRHLMPEE